MQRRVPPPLDFRPKSKQTTSASSPPRTPPPFKIRARPKRASNVHADRQTPRETYLHSKNDDGENARGGGESQIRDERISHDLSLTDNNRYSVVDNMLMSLNPEPSSTPPDSLAFSAPSRFVSPRGSHRRGHTHSSSLNTDFTLPFDDSPLRSSGQATRSRRSNSSSNFQSGLGRIDSVHRDEDRLDHVRAKINPTQRGYAGEKNSGASNRKSRKSSKSSGSSSVDFGHIMGQPRWQQTLPTRRSSSFERSYGTESSPPPKRPVEKSPTVGSFPSPIQYHVSDAAPTPTVPVGPGPSPGFPSQPVHAPPQVPSTLSWNNHKSPKPYTSRKNKAGSLHKGTEGKGGINMGNAQEDDSVPAFVISRNPSPTRHGSTTSAGFKSSPASQFKEHPKERPGFFRRVFGSSRNNPSWTTEASPVQLQSSRNSVRAESRGSFASPQKLSKVNPVEDVSSQLKENIPPVLAKKPSSFFRRRKKSVSGPNNPMALPLQLRDRGRSDLEKTPVDQRPGSSSISSLREVMNPYLGRAPPSHPRGGSNRESTAAGHRGSISTTNLVPNESKVMSKSKPLSLTRETPLDGRVGHLRQNQPQDHGTRTDNGPRSTPQDTPHRSGRAKADDVLLSTQNSFFNDNSSTETKTIRSFNNAELPDLDPELPLEMSSGGGRDMKYTIDPTNQQTPTLPQTPLSLRKLKPLPSRSGTFPPATPSSGNILKHAKTADWHAALENIPTGGSISRAGPPPRLAGAWLATEELEDTPQESDRANLPFGGVQPSPASEYQSASSTLVTPKTLEPGGNSSLHHPQVVDTAPSGIGDAEPTEDDRLLAQRIYDGDESFIAKERAAAWLGEAEPDRARVRRAYMELFDWQNLNILISLRDFCSRLVLKGETQQVDRILDAFSWRWCVCNSNHGFKATGKFVPLTQSIRTDWETDVVHTICYSILLLNTDLHMADIEQKMTRAQFIKNTIPTIRRVAMDAAPESFESKRASILPGASPWAKPCSDGANFPGVATEKHEGRPSYEISRPSYRLSTRPSDHSGHGSSHSPTRLDNDITVDDCGPLVKNPFRGKMSAWEAQIEIVLKEFFNCIRQQRLPLHGNDAKENTATQAANPNSLSIMTGNLLRRTPSVLSKAGSENIALRGRTLEHRLGTGRWTSKTRSRPRAYPASTVGSSRTSFEDQSSIWSPSVSSTWSKYSLGKTQTSMSTESFGSGFPPGGYQQSIGFANALSQAIIREESAGGDVTEDSMRAAPLLEDESLELAGAPWAKEGIVKHKHHLDALDKRAKDRNWIETFAVIERGWMRLFSFSMNAKSLRQKAKSQKAPGGVVGGGNWADSAENLGRFLLRHTIASALPPPGYSKTRPHVWALSLPTGAVHLFQVGTPEIVKEFVTTANYWSARLSKEPLIGAISNVEYGWSESVINAASTPNESAPMPTVGSGPRPSLQNSVRSSIEQGGAFRPKLPGDKVIISDWPYPQQSMMASVLLEADQLKALLAYVKNIEEELQKHNELRSAMLLAVSVFISFNVINSFRLASVN